MKEDEYANLNELNKVFEQKTIKEISNKKKEKKIPKFDKKTLAKKIVNFSKKFLKKSYEVTKKLSKKILLIVKTKYNSAKKQIIEYNEARKGKIAYKIVETKKEKRNKIIIVRKRVPINTHLNNKISNNLNPSIYYCRLKPEEKNICEKNIIGHTRLKKSIWDFPMKK